MGENPVFSPGSKEPRREAGPAAMGHPPWGSSITLSSYLTLLLHSGHDGQGHQDLDICA